MREPTLIESAVTRTSVAASDALCTGWLLHGAVVVTVVPAGPAATEPDDDGPVAVTVVPAPPLTAVSVVPPLLAVVPGRVDSVEPDLLENGDEPRAVLLLLPSDFPKVIGTSRPATSRPPTMATRTAAVWSRLRSRTGAL